MRIGLTTTILIRNQMAHGIETSFTAVGMDRKIHSFDILLRRRGLLVRATSIRVIS